MRRSAAEFYRDPETRSELKLQTEREDRDVVLEGALVSPSGKSYPIRNGIPDLSFPPALVEAEDRARSFYEARVDDYDRYLHLTFEKFGESEDAVRDFMTGRLNLKPDDRVLEVGCGTGRDSVHIARRIPRGSLFCQDLSPKMVAAARERLKDSAAAVEFSVASASYLPFEDKSFGAVYQFGGVGEFGDVARFFREAVRVTNVGGRIVVGDESMPPWLRDTEFAKVLTFTNPQYDAPLPLQHLPLEARDVHLQWVIGATFYLLDFTVGEGPPKADLDFPIPGPRGGTLRTRYYGQLEGVTPEAKALAHKARDRANVSMHDWLEKTVRDAARAQLGEEPES